MILFGEADELPVIGEAAAVDIPQVVEHDPADRRQRGDPQSGAGRDLYPATRPDEPDVRLPRSHRDGTGVVGRVGLVQPRVQGVAVPVPAVAESWGGLPAWLAGLSVTPVNVATPPTNVAVCVPPSVSPVPVLDVIVRLTLPVKLGTGLKFASSAVMPTMNGLPAATLPGGGVVWTSCVATLLTTAIGFVVALLRLPLEAWIV